MANENASTVASQCRRHAVNIVYETYSHLVYYAITLLHDSTHTVDSKPLPPRLMALLIMPIPWETQAVMVKEMFNG